MKTKRLTLLGDSLLYEAFASEYTAIGEGWHVMTKVRLGKRIRAKKLIQILEESIVATKDEEIVDVDRYRMLILKDHGGCHIDLQCAGSLFYESYDPCKKLKRSIALAFIEALARKGLLEFHKENENEICM